MEATNRTGPPAGTVFRDNQQFVATAQVDGDLVTIENLRDGSYPPGAERQLRWTTRTVDLAELTNVHWMLESWGHSVRGVAHSMLCFEFADGNNVVASVEARQPKGSRYNVIDGFRRRYGLAYLWLSEADALLSRCHRSDTTQVASLEARLSQHRAREIFLAAIERTNQVAASPEWYHSAKNNCQTNMVGWVDGVMPGQVPRNPRHLMPGFLPEYLVRKKMVWVRSETGDVVAAHDVIPRAREIGEAPDFGIQLRNRLRS